MFFASVRQSVRLESNTPPLTAFLPLRFVDVHSQQLPQKSMPPQAPFICAYASTGCYVSPTPQLKSASFGMCPAANSHSPSVGGAVGVRRGVLREPRAVLYELHGMADMGLKMVNVG